MKTRGDLMPDTPFEEIPEREGKGLFTDALEKALRGGEIDLCVHSLKDLAVNLDEALPIVGVARRADPRDMLVLPFHGVAGCFYAGAREALAAVRGPVGCGGPRRRVQLLSLAPGLDIAPIRGNVPTRLSKLESGGYGALVLAAAGLARLGMVWGEPGGILSGLPAVPAFLDYVFSVEEMVPAAGQGALALQGRRGEDYGFLDAVRDPVTEEETSAERVFIQTLGCGCGSPAAAYARVSGNEVLIAGLYALNAEAPLFREEIAGGRKDAPRLARELARSLARKAGA
jgi:hydroxymethylbilane synthase